MTAARCQTGWAFGVWWMRNAMTTSAIRPTTLTPSVFVLGVGAAGRILLADSLECQKSELANVDSHEGNTP